MGEPVSEARVTYADSGVDLDAAAAHTANIARLLPTTGFAAGVALPPGMREPVLVGATDGVGTKLLLARQLGRLDGLGQDLVAMSVNDLACTGATPLFFLDYLAVGRLDPEEAGRIVASIAAACDACGCPLVGGETAEMPGLYAPGHFDLAGFACGVVERDDMLGPERVRAGDAIVGLPSSGLHSNGYTLVRRLLDDGAIPADADALLAPTRLYPREVAAVRSAGAVRAAAHITGGGIVENLPRALPEGLCARLDDGAWDDPPAVRLIAESGRVGQDEMRRTFNMGLGMCLIVAPEDALACADAVPDARIVGAVATGARGVAW